ncbi:MAG: carboxypeptidase regulatory-like domain-containing protein [Bacteroidales bacterium]|nr:carboxypeptidase regulatory-like domain-containing protein [Bacteroidales bacterium]
MKYFINKVQLLIIIGLLSFVFGSQTNSQGYLTNMKVHDEPLSDGYGIICVSVSEFGASPIPIVGAIVTVWGCDTIYQCITGTGDTCCWEVPEGTYTVMVEAEGYVSEICENIYISEYPPIFVIEFQLYEFPYPALGVWAERNNAHMEAFVEWYEYSDFYQIIYDDNIADNVTAWSEAGNMNALRFTPAGYPAEIFSAQINIFDGTWPPGNSLTPFQVAIYDDDGENGLPNTELAITTVTPFDYGWVDVDFSQFAVSIPDGDFYVVMIQGGDFPDCAPIAIDESNPVYRSYSKNVSGGMPWNPSDFADFMMRAFVYSEVDGAQILSYNDKIDIPESESQALSRFGSNVKPGTYDVGFGRFIPKGEKADLRDFDHYEVWVLSEGDELNPELWTLKDDAVLETEYTDSDWTSYANGWYRYAVVSAYTYNWSEPAFSNVLPRGLDHRVTLMVRTDSGDPAVGAHVIFNNENGDPAWQLEGYTDETGRVHFEVVLEGYYALEINLEYYNPYVQLYIPVYNDTTINIELTEIFLPPQEFHVNSMIGKATWLPPQSYYNKATNKARELEGYNLYMEDTLVAFTTALTYMYTDLMICQEYTAGIEAQYTDGKSSMVTFPFTYYTCDFFFNPNCFEGSVNGMVVSMNWDPWWWHFGLYDIIYDDDTMENVAAWNEENGEFAVRFTPQGYPCDLISFTMHIWDGSWPEGDILSPFVINVYDDDGPDDAPGTLLGSLERTPEEYGWVTFDITELEICVSNGEFYLAHQQIGTFPDVPPTAVDESSAGQGRSYSRIPPDQWMPDTTYDQLAIRAGVFGPYYSDMVLTPTTIEIIGESVVNKAESAHEFPEERNRFNLLGYDVYRNNIKQNDTILTNNSYVDIVSPGGIYYYNVISVYDMGESCPMDPPFEAIVGAEFFPPTDLSGTLLENDSVLLTWNIPGEHFWLHWDDGENFYSIGLTSGGSFLVASRWEEEDLVFYHGMIMTEIAFFPTDSNTTYVLKVWTGDNASNLIVSQPLSNLSINQWNSVVLDTPLEINAFEELWFGYENIDQPAGEHSAGTDDGPAIAGYGDMICMDGVTWDPISIFGLDYNWNLQAYLEIEGDAVPLTTIIQEPIHNTGEVYLEASKSAGGVFDGNQRETFLGYNLWRNGNMIAYVPEPDTFYLDYPGPGFGEYYITAVFVEGESFTDGPAEVEILNDGSITGIVYDAFSLVPLQGATVTLDTSGIEIITDENGKYDFTDIEVGSYYVKASAMGYNNGSAYEVDVIYNDVVTADVFLYSDSVILPIPFYEPWDEDFAAQYWTFDPEPGNWQQGYYLGNPLPAVEFYFSPATTGYSYTLQSIGIDARMATPNVVLEFDLYLNDYSSTGLEFLTVEVWDGTDWVYIDEYANNGDIEWDHKFYNITDYALGIITKVRFIAHGANSYAINNWAIDNILVSETTLASMQGYVTDEESGDPIEAAMIEVGSNLPVYTDEEGFYSVGVLESTYSVICSAEGYLPELVEEIFITGVISQDFALEMEACDPPMYLILELVGETFNVVLTWESPVGGIDPSPNAKGPNYGVRSLLGFNVYRNDVQINDSLVLDTTYVDGELFGGSYWYYVTAVYTLCESEPSNLAGIFCPGIDDLLVSNIKVYPIPATNFVNVEIPANICEIRMVNYLGDIVYVRNLEMAKFIRIRTGAYSSGIYLLEFVGEGGSKTSMRIIITK